MKTIIRTLLFAGVLGVAAGCGGNGKKTAAQPVEDVVPEVSVVKVASRSVDQLSVYTSTVEPFVKTI